MEKQKYAVKPIGTVRAGSRGFAIEIEKTCRPGLKGLKGFSHLVVVWWGNLVDGEEYRSCYVCNKPYTKGPEKLGVFATRSPVRPNPVEISTVPVINVDEKTGIIHIPWIDAEDGSPVLDVKPYHPSEDRVRNVTVPEWCGHWPQWFEESANFDWNEEISCGV